MGGGGTRAYGLPDSRPGHFHSPQDRQAPFSLSAWGSVYVNVCACVYMCVHICAYACV